jgi:FtsZ-binding cell division protein ZapB
VELDLDRLLLQFEVEELKDLLNQIGMRAFSAHTGFERLEYGIENTIKSIKILGLDF